MLSFTREVTGEVLRLLSFCREPKSRKALMEHLGLRHEEHFRIAYLLPALGLDLLEMTIPDKPTSRFQKYYLTAHGKALLAKGEKG
jgi:ATP-dependent DNA helicase RecG